MTSVALCHGTQATSCRFSCVLSIRSTSLGPAHIQRVTQELDCQGAWGTGSRFRRLPTPGGADGKGPTCQYRRHKRRGFNPCSGRSPGGGHGKPLKCSCLENPSTEEPGGLHSMGSQRVRQDYSDLAYTTPDMESKWILFCPLTLTESAILHLSSPLHKSCILIPKIPSSSTYGSRRS